MSPPRPTGDLEEQFIAAYDAYADSIFRHLALRIGDRELGRDMMQETFLRAWEYLSRGAQIENLRAFLYKVANNLLVDTARRKRLRKEESFEDLHEAGFDLPAETENPGTLVDGKRLMAILRQVDEPYRTAVIMRHIDGLPPQEIAELLGTSSNVVSVRIHRGLEKLRSLLPSYE